MAEARAGSNATARVSPLPVHEAATFATMGSGELKRPPPAGPGGVQPPNLFGDFVV